MRLHSQLTVKAIESLRFASGDEEIRSILYDELGEPLFENFASVEVALEKLVNEWGNGDDEEESEEERSDKEGIAGEEKEKAPRCQDWERDGRLSKPRLPCERNSANNCLKTTTSFVERVDEALPKLKSNSPRAI